MTDKELQSLRSLPVPEPDADARAAAIRAALDAFFGSTQESEPAVRRRGVSSHERSLSMKQSSKLALAASLAVLAIGVPATIHFLQTNGSAGRQETKSSEPGRPEIVSQPVPPAAQSIQSRAAAPVSDGGQISIQAMRGSTDRGAGSPREKIVASSGPAGFVGDGMRLEQSEAFPPRPVIQVERDRFQNFTSNPIKQVREEPVSTFSIDVDTGSYAFVRRMLMAGRVPPKDAVRVEEMINYFPYDYALPKDRSAPFAPTVTVMPAPWNAAKRIMHVAIKGFDAAPAERPRANLVFLVDTSGSMAGDDRLPLLKSSLRMLVDAMKPDDTIGIVTYAGQARAALEPTRVAEKAKILAAIDQLQAGGSTAGGAGIEIGYRMAEGAFDRQAVNRVILGTDGDFNVGVSDPDQLKSLIERKRESGIYLSVLGFGQGNYNDRLMQALAQNGNGTAAYIDTLNEARKVLAEEASSTLFPIARDVKIQIEFNPVTVSEYRLIGYETRALRREDFNNDKVDAGEIGAGHTVTAIYELTPAGAPASADALRYRQAPVQPAAVAPGNVREIGFLKIRYKLPGEETSRLIEQPVPVADEVSVEGAPADVRFSTAVAAFGQMLRGEPHLGQFGADDIVALAHGAKGSDPFGYRSEFINLVRLAKSVRP